MKYYLAMLHGGFVGICCEDTTKDKYAAMRAMKNAVEVDYNWWAEVPHESYSNTVIDLQYEDGEVVQ